MKTLQVSAFKARCLGLFKEIRDTGEPLAVTLRGETLAIITPPGAQDPQCREYIAETLARVRPLLHAEDSDLEPPPRDSIRPTTSQNFLADD